MTFSAIELEAEGERLVLEVVTSSSKITPVKKGNGSVKMKIEITAETVFGNQTGTKNLITPESFQDLEQKAVQVIWTNIHHAVEQAQEMNADIFEFGEKIHQQCPKEWAALEPKWDEQFKIWKSKSMLR